MPGGLAVTGELGAFLAEREVTVAWLTAGLFRLAVEFAPGSLAGLRQLLTGGDVVPHEHAARALARNPGLVITNGYGPTENTTFTATYSVTRPKTSTGRCPSAPRYGNLGVRAGRAWPAGASRGGGRAVRGRRGPRRRLFRRRSGDGQVFRVFLGRCTRVALPHRRQGAHRLPLAACGSSGGPTTRLKIRGYRIELSAMSAALTGCPGVHDAVVTVTKAGSACKRLVAAVVPEPGATVVPAQLRTACRTRCRQTSARLWAVVDRVPVTANGKVDRRALAALAALAEARLPRAASRRRGPSAGAGPVRGGDRACGRRRRPRR